jgi:hypothetical protein
LGMANSLTTLMQIIIADMVINRCNDEVGAFEATPIAYNDDFTVCFKDELSMELYIEKDEEVVKGLDHLVVRDKSFKGHVMVLCETYFPHWINRKDSYYHNEVSMALASRNICEAKARISALSTSCHPKYFQHWANEIIAKFGYEFHPEEVHQPSIFGGWMSFRIGSVSLDYVKAKENFQEWMVRAFKACQNRSIRYNLKGSKKPYISPGRKLLGCLADHLSAELKDVLRLDMSVAQVRALFTSTLSEKLQFGAWDGLYKRRQKEFNKIIPVGESQNIWDMITEAYPDVDFLPTQDLVIDEIPVVHYIPKVALYESENPVVDALAYEVPYFGSYMPNPYWFRAIRNKAMSQKLSSNDMRKRIGKAISNKGMSLYGSIVTGGVHPSREEDKDLCVRCWMDPGAVATAWELTYHATCLPIVNKVHGLHKYKVAVYDREFTLFEEYRLSMVNWPRSAVYKVARASDIDLTDNSDYHEFSQLVVEATHVAKEQEKPIVLFDPEADLTGTRKRFIPLNMFWQWYGNYFDHANETLVGAPWEMTFQELGSKLRVREAQSGGTIFVQHGGDIDKTYLDEAEYCVWRANSGKQLPYVDTRGYCLDDEGPGPPEEQEETGDIWNFLEQGADPVQEEDNDPDSSEVEDLWGELGY